MRLKITIDEAEYKMAQKHGAMSLIAKDKQKYISKAEVVEIGGKYYLTYEEKMSKGASYKNGWSHTIV